MAPWSANHLVLLTQSFPFERAREATFVGPELPFLVEAFGRVRVFPSSDGGARTVVPDGVDVDLSLIEWLGRGGGRYRRMRGALTSGLFFRDICDLRSQDLVRGVRASAAYVARAEMVAQWVASRDWQGNTLMYSYWSDETALGAVIAAEKNRSIRVVSRAHGYDLFEERQVAGRIPLRSYFVARVSRIFSVSRFGRQYLAARYPGASDRIDVARLGVLDPIVRAKASVDGVVRIVSCSALVGVKRVHLIVEALRMVGNARPEMRFEWRHYGDGACLAQVRDCAKSLPKNVSAILVGHVSREELFAAYARLPVDVFVNVSSSEGVPVAVMEAQAHGIPVVATSVGGTSEIVDGGNGCLLSAYASPLEIGEALVAVAKCQDKRVASRESWERMSNAALLHSEFAARLRALSG